MKIPLLVIFTVLLTLIPCVSKSQQLVVIAGANDTTLFNQPFGMLTDD